MPSKKPRIRLYADECFPVTSVTFLKSLGISIVHAYDKNYTRRSDRFHLEQSKKLDRVLITLDRDFNYYEEASLKDHPGVIIISVGSAIPPNVNRISRKALKILTLSFIKGALIKVTDNKIIRIKKGVLTQKAI